MMIEKLGIENANLIREGVSNPDKAKSSMKGEEEQGGKIMKSKCLIVLFLISAYFLTSGAAMATILYEFTGNITSVRNEYFPEAFGPVAVGNSFTYRLFVDETSGYQPYPLAPNLFFYELTGMSLDIEGIRYVETNSIEHLSLANDQINTPNNRTEDWVITVNHLFTHNSFLAPIAEAKLVMYATEPGLDNPPTALTSLDLPLFPLDPAEFNYTHGFGLSLTYYVDIDGYLLEVPLYLGGEITGSAFSASVPEPSTMLLFGSGLLGLWGFRKKFRK